MAKPWDNKQRSQRPQRRGSKFSVLFKLFLAYVAFLAFWKCPIGKPLHCSCTPCATLHSVYDNQVVPLWQQHGQQYYTKIEPYTGPIIEKSRPHAAKAREFLADRISALLTAVEPYVDVIRDAIEPHLTPLRPHWTSLTDVASRVQTSAAPHAAKAWDIFVDKFQILLNHMKLLYASHVGPRLSQSFRTLDQHNTQLLDKFSAFVDAKYQQILESAHEWLTQKITPQKASPTIADATVATDATVSTPVGEITPEIETQVQETVVPESTQSAHTAEGTIHDGEDFIQDEPSSSSSISTSSSTRHSKDTAGPGKPATPKLSWSARVSRTARSAMKNLNTDCKELQEKIIESAKPGIMLKLRDISKYGEEAVREITKLTNDVEAETAKYKTDDELYERFDSKAVKLQNLLLAVRTDCEALAQEVINRIAEFRQEALESLDDFFDIVLIEAGKDAAEGDDGEDDWKKWQTYSKLKKQLSTIRKEVEEYDPDTEIVNGALRESQQAGILMVQEFTNQLRTMRARAQFFLQQKHIIAAKEREGEPIDADWYDISKELGDDEKAERAQEAAEEAADSVQEAADAKPIPESAPEPHNPDVEQINQIDIAELEDTDEETFTEFVTEVVYETRFNTHASSSQ